jgi:hypothetical protein
VPVFPDARISFCRHVFVVPGPRFSLYKGQKHWHTLYWRKSCKKIFAELTGTLVQGVQCGRWAYFQVVFNGKVGHNFVGETERGGGGAGPTGN